MQQIITAKLKLLPTLDQARQLRQTQQAYRDALNVVSQYAFQQGKTSSVTRLHKGTYAELRLRYGLPSQLACSVERQVAATYKGLWTKLKKNVELYGSLAIKVDADYTSKACPVWIYCR